MALTQQVRKATRQLGNEGSPISAIVPTKEDDRRRAGSRSPSRRIPHPDLARIGTQGEMGVSDPVKESGLEAGTVVDDDESTWFSPLGPTRDKAAEQWTLCVARGGTKEEQAVALGQSKDVDKKKLKEVNNNLYNLAGPLLQPEKKKGAKAREASESQKVTALYDLEECLRRGISPHSWEGPGTPLHAFLKEDNHAMVDLLLRARASANEVDDKGVSLLHLAVFQGSMPLCRRLLEDEADANLADRHGQSPIFFAPKPAICQLLNDRKANINVVNNKGQSTLHLAARAGNEGVLEWLMKHVSRELMDINDSHGATVTYYARAAGVRHGLIQRLYSEARHSDAKPRKVGEQEERKGAIVSHIVPKSPLVSRSPDSPLLTVEEELPSTGAARTATSTPNSASGQKSGTQSPMSQASTFPGGSSPLEASKTVHSRDGTGRSPAGKSSQAHAQRSEADRGAQRSVLKSGQTPESPSPTQSRTSKRSSVSPAAIGVNPADLEKERARIRKELEQEMRSQMVQFEKEKKQVAKELEKMKAQMKDMKTVRESASSNKSAQGQIEKLKKANQDLTDQRRQLAEQQKELQGQKKAAELETKKVKRKNEQMAKHLKDHKDIRAEAAIRIQRAFRNWRFVRLARREKKRKEKERRRQEREEQGPSHHHRHHHHQHQHRREDASTSPGKGTITVTELTSAGSSPASPAKSEPSEDRRRQLLTVKAGGKEVAQSPRSPNVKQAEGKEPARASARGASPPRSPRGHHRAQQSKDSRRRKEVDREAARREAEEKRKAAEEAEQERVAEEKRRMLANESPQDKAARLAAERLQQTYRRSVVIRQLKEAPVEGAWALCKALRNQQAVRDFKEAKVEKEKKDMLRLQEAYAKSNPVAGKILEMEDKSYAAKQQAKRLDMYFKWEMVVTALIEQKLSGRMGMARVLAMGTPTEEDKEPKSPELTSPKKTAKPGKKKGKQKESEKTTDIKGIYDQSDDEDDGWTVSTEVVQKHLRERSEERQKVTKEREERIQTSKSRDLDDFMKRKHDNDPAVQDAATKIQARYRGKLSRKETQKLKEKKKEEKKKHQAATKIQAKHRGNQGRRAAAEQKEALMAAQDPGMLIPPDKLAQLKFIFNTCDINGDGVISKEELLEASEKTSGFEGFFEGIDADGNGKIDWEEFQRFFVRSRKKTDMDAESGDGDDEEGREFFAEFNLDWDEPEESF